jgi:chaperonin GroEL
MDEIADAMELMPDKDGFIADRISRLKCGLVNLYVAGKTPIEVGDRRELIDDAIKATLSAIRGGVLPGGGKAMVWMSNQLWTSPLPSRIEEAIAYKAIIQVLLAPLKQLMENCYYNEAQFEATKDILLKSDLFGMGFNFLEGTYENFLDTCTLDPADMPIAALENAVSVVGQLLKMDWFVNIEKKA